MINDDILIKIIRQRGHLYDWPKYVRAMRKRIEEMKIGFPGINNNHLDLVEFNTIQENDLFIWDLYIDSLDRFGDEAPLLLQKLQNKKALIEGIGCGIDSRRDPDRLKFRWRDIIEMPNIKSNDLVYKYVARPDLFNGGASYYYWFKAYRDNRY